MENIYFKKYIQDEFCPCGNKLPYKDCHENMDKILSDEIDIEEKKRILSDFQKEKELFEKESANALCIVDGCNFKACKSHTVSE